MKPKVIWIGGHAYRLRVGKRAWNNLRSRDKDSRDNVGQTDHSNTTIYVSPDQGPSELRETSLHEVLHCLIYDSGSAEEFRMRKGESLDDFEERLVSKLSPRLFSLIIHNPDYVRWLLGE